MIILLEITAEVALKIQVKRVNMTQESRLKNNTFAFHIDDDK